MAREYRAQDGRQSAFLTEYVTTRWYRAPEVMISPNNYSKLSELFLIANTMEALFTYPTL